MADTRPCYAVHHKAPWEHFEISCLFDVWSSLDKKRLSDKSERQFYDVVKTVFPLWFQYICRTACMTGRIVTLEFTQTIWNTIYWSSSLYCNLCGFRKNLYLYWYDFITLLYQYWCNTIAVVCSIFWLLTCSLIRFVYRLKLGRYRSVIYGKTITYLSELICVSK